MHFQVQPHFRALCESTQTVTCFSECALTPTLSAHKWSYRSLFHGLHNDLLQSCGLLLISRNPCQHNNLNNEKLYLIKALTVINEASQWANILYYELGRRMAYTTSRNTKLNTCALLSQLWSYSGYVVYMEHEEQLYMILTGFCENGILRFHHWYLLHCDCHIFSSYITSKNIILKYTW